ncbi:SAM-dependent methyltransferase [Herbidospora yilanensis]|uniref:SAM-dependent methyltransferase n=1 Tax=Herbidospora yilanensis TaxID=354426 RepID=UPI000A98995A|nr:SAM-dependent methyltransferase [Herbidospora yilanensis]
MSAIPLTGGHPLSEHEPAPSWVIDPHKPSVARMYDYYLGGKDNFAADREAADEILARMPYVRDFTRENRAFLSRVVRLLAARGIRQFLDIGSGLPTRENTHQVAQAVARDARVVYVDNDPIVLAHGRALLAKNRNTAVVRADLHDPKGIIDHPEVRALIDFSQPVAIMLLAIVHFVPDDDEASRIVRELRVPMVPGSYLVMSHGHMGEVDDDLQEVVYKTYRQTTSGNITARTSSQVAAYFEGMELLEPGIVQVGVWRPEISGLADADPRKAGFFGAVGVVR